MAPKRIPTLRRVARAARVAAAALPAAAQQNIEARHPMTAATTDLNIPVVPLTGRNADAIRANLKPVKLPPGCHTDRYTVVTEVVPQGKLIQPEGEDPNHGALGARQHHRPTRPQHGACG